MKKLMMMILISSFASSFAAASSKDSADTNSYVKNLICNALVKEQSEKIAGDVKKSQYLKCTTEGYIYALDQNLYSVTVAGKFGLLVCRAEIYNKANGSKTPGVNISSCKNISSKPRMGGSN